MFFPLRDENPLRIVPFQFVTLAIIVMTALTFFAEQGGAGALLSAAYSFGLVPVVLFDGAALPPELALVPAELTLLSYMFLHGDVWHLLGNMLFLWVFGDNIEDAMGHWRFLFFYLFCGVVAGLIHSLWEPASGIPVVGASGAVAGVLGAYLVLHPRVKVLVLVLKFIPVHLPALLLLAGWLIFQVISFYSDEDRHVAWLAHIGGFIAGALLVVPLRDRRIPLFDRGVAH